jgi:thioredoxin 1
MDGQSGKPPAAVNGTTPADLHCLFTGDVPVLLDFWAPWCRPCRRLEPVLHRLGIRFGATLKIAKINVDLNSEVARRFNVRSLPTLLLARQGQEALRLAAAECSEEYILAQLEKHL